MIIKKITEVPRIIYIIFVLIFFLGGGGTEIHHILFSTKHLPR